MILRSELESVAQLMTSAGADFVRNTWEFRAPTFRVSGGDYLVISVKDWREIWERFDGPRQPLTQEVKHEG